MEIPWTGNLHEHVQFAERGTVSKTLVDIPGAKVVLFSMVTGQSLSEHTASVPASIEVLAGRAVIRLDDTDHEGEAGFYVFMPAGQRHAVTATADLVFLLTLFRA